MSVDPIESSTLPSNAPVSNEEIDSTKFNEHTKIITIPSDSEEDDTSDSTIIINIDEDIDEYDSEDIEQEAPIPINDFTELAGPSSPNDTVEDNLAGPSGVQEEDLKDLYQRQLTLAEGPKEAEEVEGLNVKLMDHQRTALSWLIWREQQRPSGGILADDMGLGKTLTMISLILKSKEERTSSKKGGTLIVCTASVLYQWQDELNNKTNKDQLKLKIHHGPGRTTDHKELLEVDVVLTTYDIVSREFNSGGPVFKVEWSRVIIDEAHKIRNRKSRRCKAVCQLHSTYRWALTGTPVHNKKEDMNSLLKFLSGKSKEAEEKLKTVTSSVMLRRTKEELKKTTLSNELPERTYELIPVTLDPKEQVVHDKIMIFSKKLFELLLERQAKRQGNDKIAAKVDGERFRQKILQLQNMNDIKINQMLVLLLRLQQICNHPSLIINMLSQNDEVNLMEGDVDELQRLFSGLSLTDQLLNVLVSDDPNEDIENIAIPLLNRSNPIFQPTFSSSKIEKLFELIGEKLSNNDDKAIVVSQWPSFLKFIADRLEDEKKEFCQLDGQVPALKRMKIINRINDPMDPAKIMLLSLKAGGEGLNLIGANHLFILDFHLNPQMENLAMDRIYRIGQKKPIHIYKLIALKTFEENIFKLYQEKKLITANNMLTGKKPIITSEDMKKILQKDPKS